MIQKFVDKFMACKPLLRAKFKAREPKTYLDLVKAVVRIVSEDESLSPERIHEIDDGDYQGTLLYIIGAMGYQPSRYWAVRVSYGSCSGCDTLQALQQDTADLAARLDGYMTLALHIVQGLKEI